MSRVLSWQQQMVVRCLLTPPAHDFILIHPSLINIIVDTRVVSDDTKLEPWEHMIQPAQLTNGFKNCFLMSELQLWYPAGRGRLDGAVNKITRSQDPVVGLLGASHGHISQQTQSRTVTRKDAQGRNLEGFAGKFPASVSQASYLNSNELFLQNLLLLQSAAAALLLIFDVTQEWRCSEVNVILIVARAFQRRLIPFPSQVSTERWNIFLLMLVWSATISPDTLVPCQSCQ